MPKHYFKNLPLINRDATDTHVNFADFFNKISSSKGEERIALIKKCFYEHIKKGFPFAEYHALDQLRCHYEILIRHIDEEMPTEFREEVITTLISLSNYYDYSKECEKDNLLESVCCAMFTAVILKRFMNTEQLDLLLQNVVNLLGIVFYEATITEYNDATIALFDSYKDTVYQFLATLGADMKPYDFEKKIQKHISANKEWEEIHASTGLLELLDLSDRKLRLAAQFYKTDAISAFELYSEIPAWADEYGEAQFRMAKIICHQHTPEDSRKENPASKKARLLAMKPYLDHAAASGYKPAQVEKLKLDAELENLAKPRNSAKSVKFQNLPTLIIPQRMFNQTSALLVSELGAPLYQPKPLIRGYS
jgi:hypothetical protein